MASDKWKENLKTAPEITDKTIRKEKQMDLRQMKDMLKRHGENALDLASRLGSSGVPFDDKDRKLIRIVKYEYLQECLTEASMFYFTGRQGEFKSSIDHIREEFTDDMIV